MYHTSTGQACFVVQTMNTVGYRSQLYNLIGETWSNISWCVI